MYRNGIKRLLAVILSLCGMIVLSPLLLILCIAIKVDSPGPILFKQKRVGIHKQHFNILKFRTMRIDTPHDMPTHMLKDPDQYITRVGHFPTLVAPGKTAIDTSIMFLSCWTMMTALRSSSILRCLLRSLRSSRFSFPIFMSLRLMRRMSLAMFRLTGCIMTPPALR